MILQKFAEKYCLKVKCDDCGEKIMPGRTGQIYEFGEVLAVLFMPDPRGKGKPTTRKWSKQKRALIAAGCEIVQDGDGEGAAIFNPLDEKQSALAIRIAGCRRKRVASAAQLASLASARARLQRGLRG